MKRALALSGLVLASAGPARAKPSATRGTAHAPAVLSAASHTAPAPRAAALPPLPPPRAVRAAPPLPMLAAIARVRVDAGRDRVVVVEDVSLPRGEWQAGGLDVYIAFGAPGVPVALDAHLLPETIRAEDTGERLSTEPSARRDAGSVLVLGRPQMAGVVIHLRESQLRRVYASADSAIVRIRSLLRPPAVDVTGARDVVVRLGVADGLPLTLGRVEVASLEADLWILRAEANLCGVEADPWPLAVSLTSGGRERETAAANAIAPTDVTRHASDDLCIRWWAR